MLAYRVRKRLGLIAYSRPRKIKSLETAQAIRQRWFSRQATQLELALEFGVSESTIQKICAGAIHNGR